MFRNYIIFIVLYKYGGFYQWYVLSNVEVMVNYETFTK